MVRGPASFRRSTAATTGGAGCPAGSAAYERVMAWDPRLAWANQARLRGLLAEPDTSLAVFCTHDPVEFVALSVWQGNAPAGPERVASAA